MGLAPQEQIQDQIKKSETVLICVGKAPEGDALGSALGLYMALKKMGKKVDVISPTAILEKYSFMPSMEFIAHKLQGARDYVFSLDIEKDKLQQLRYEVEDRKLKIFITAKNGEISEDKISLDSSRFNYDLIIVLGANDLEDLGNLYDENPELFYDIPVINIDHKPSNEYFGKINLVDVAASSTSEIVFNVISAAGENLIDEEVATNLLTGIIFETESFQNKNTTPKAFLNAASLIAKGANKQDIIRYLYKTKSINMLKLMGKAMANLKYNSRYKLAWSVIKDEEALQGSTAENINMAVKELAGSSPEFDLFFFIYPTGGTLKGILNFSERNDIKELISSLKGTIEEGQVIFNPEEIDIDLAEKEMLKKIKVWFDGQNQ
ncbi:MAG: DHH family phosphoesterase [Candidatus Pacebacteria bacterium]|nr:DHH family phosphoesterase [Candidatus Paceibacterota bacterium]